MAMELEEFELAEVGQPGQILVSRDTYRLTQEAFTFVALAPIRVKGKREPLPLFELERAKLHPALLGLWLVVAGGLVVLLSWLVPGDISVYAIALGVVLFLPLARLAAAPLALAWNRHR